MDCLHSSQKTQENPDLEQEGEEVQILRLGKDLLGSCYLLPPSLRSQGQVRMPQWHFVSFSVRNQSGRVISY